MTGITIVSEKEQEFINITLEIEKYLLEHEDRNGILFVNALDTTTAVTISENSDEDVNSDILKALDALIPKLNFENAEGNSGAHLKATIIGSSLTIPVVNGKLVRGTWQGVCFCEFDGPRTREINLTFLESK